MEIFQSTIKLLNWITWLLLYSLQWWTHRESPAVCLCSTELYWLNATGLFYLFHYQFRICALVNKSKRCSPDLFHEVQPNTARMMVQTGTLVKTLAETHQVKSRFQLFFCFVFQSHRMIQSSWAPWHVMTFPLIWGPSPAQLCSLNHELIS